MSYSMRANVKMKVKIIARFEVIIKVNISADLKVYS